MPLKGFGHENTAETSHKTEKLMKPSAGSMLKMIFNSWIRISLPFEGLLIKTDEGPCLFDHQVSRL